MKWWVFNEIIAYLSNENRCKLYLNMFKRV